MISARNTRNPMKVRSEQTPRNYYSKKNDRFTSKPVEPEKQEIIKDINSKLVSDFNKNSTYFNSLKSCAEILGFDQDYEKDLTITDNLGNLNMLNYVNENDPSIYSKIRGTLIDLETNSVIADSFGFTQILNNDGKDLEVNDGKVKLGKDEIPLENLNFSRFFDGVNMRLIYHKNQMYMISRRKIDTSRSFWRVKKCFPNIYAEAGGPKVEQLFDTRYPFSSTCYDIVICDPVLAISSRLNITKPFIVLVREREMQINRPDDQVAKGILRQSGFEIKREMNFENPDSGFYEFDNMTIDEVNYFLKYGYQSKNQNDKNSYYGESVVAFTKDKNNAVDFLVRVVSPFIARSIKLRDNNSDIENQYGKLVAKYSRPNSFEQFNNEMMFVELIDNETLIREIEKNGYYSPVVRSLTTEEKINEFEKLLIKERIVWLNFIATIPPNLQLESAKGHRFESSSIDNMTPDYIVDLFVRGLMNNGQSKIFFPSKDLIEYLSKLNIKTNIDVKFILHIDTRKQVKPNYQKYFMFLDGEKIKEYVDKPNRTRDEVINDSKLKPKINMLKTIVNQDYENLSPKIKNDITRMIKREAKQSEM